MCTHSSLKPRKGSFHKVLSDVNFEVQGIYRAVVPCRYHRCYGCPNINIHVLFSVLYIFLMVLVWGIWISIETFNFGDHVRYSHDLAVCLIK